MNAIIMYIFGVVTTLLIIDLSLEIHRKQITKMLKRKKKK